MSSPHRCFPSNMSWRGQAPGHLPYGDRVAGDQPDQAAPGLVRLRVQGQHVVVIKLREPGTDPCRMPTAKTSGPCVG